MNQQIRALTLIELIIATILLSLIILGFSGIELFSRYQVLSADRRASVQNNVTIALEHMAKRISMAVGNAVSDPAIRRYANGSGIRIRIDSNGNGQADGGDTWIAYCHENVGAPIADSEILYYPDAGFNEPPSGDSISLIRRVVIGNSGLEFVPVPASGGIFDAQRWLRDSFLEITVRCRWDPSQAASTDNPEVTMRTIVKMAAVSRN